MKNFTLNPGGVIGVLALVAIVIVMAWPEAGQEPTMDDMYRTLRRMFLPAVLVGAFGGNFLWSLIFSKKK